MSAKSKQAKTSLRKAKQYVWYHQERKRHHRSILGVEPGIAVRVNPGSWEKISDPQDLVIFNQAKKKSLRYSISQEGRLKVIPPSPHFFRIIYLEKPCFHFYKNTRNKRIEITEWNPHSNSLGHVFLAKIDVVDAFYHISIHTADVPKLGVILPT
jgi:hypothetical protein